MLPDITKAVGSTPLIELRHASKQTQTRILAKVESFNPASSVKDRIGIAMINHGFKTGDINTETTIVEPTSGNTGIALAFVCRVRGLKLILTMPESMSLERRKLLTHLGADLVLTPGKGGMAGSVDAARKILGQTPNSFMPDQFSNPANPEIHRQTTGPEIWEATQGRVDIFVAGVGTGGTITGVSEMLKKKNPELKSVAIEPSDSPVLSGGPAGPHKIQGIGANFIPINLNMDILDEILAVESQDAIDGAKNLALQEGILCGISSGAAFHGARTVAARPENKGKTIVFIIPDTGERYLSTDLF